MPSGSVVWLFAACVCHTSQLCGGISNQAQSHRRRLISLSPRKAATAALWFHVTLVIRVILETLLLLVCSISGTLVHDVLLNSVFEHLGVVPGSASVLTGRSGPPSGQALLLPPGWAPTEPTSAGDLSKPSPVVLSFKSSPQAGVQLLRRLHFAGLWPLLAFPGSYLTVYQVRFPLRTATALLLHPVGVMPSNDRLLRLDLSPSRVGPVPSHLWTLCAQQCLMQRKPLGELRE